MLPSQIYRPQNFNEEVKEIETSCKLIHRGFTKVYVDKDGNQFQIDWDLQAIYVN